MKRPRLTTFSTLVAPALTVLITAAALALAACGGSGQATSTTTPATATSPLVSTTGTTAGSPSTTAR